MVNKTSAHYYPQILSIEEKVAQGNQQLAPDYQSFIADKEISALIKEFGSPLFVFEESKIRKNIRNLLAAFNALYPSVIHGWSYKTNYLNAICQIMHEEGSWAEIVSEFEYDKASALGIAGNKIIYNGPYKSKNSLVKALSEGAIINIDNFDELELIEQISKELNKKSSVSIRINCNTYLAEHWVKFGFHYESGEALYAAKIIAASNFLTLNGIHNHVGTFIIDPEVYKRSVKTMCELIKEIKSATNQEIEIINVGGGFASPNKLKTIYLPTAVTIPSYRDYAYAICNTITDFYQKNFPGQKLPKLILESGRSVIDDSACLISSVVAGKVLPNGSKAYILDGGINLLYTSNWYDHPLKLTKKYSQKELYNSTLFGPLCMNIDVLRKNVMLPNLQTGDPLLFLCCGAYNLTQWMQFIEMRPNVVLIKSNGDIKLIRKKEDVSTLNNQEIDLYQ